MKIQMVVMANARETRGRSLVGILLNAGRPVFRADGRPHWLRPVLHRGKASIPAPLVVDLVPQDVIEFDIASGSTVHEPGGWLEIDLYSLKVKGKLSLDTVESCCWVVGTGVLQELAEEDILSRELSMILACRCSVVVHASVKDGPKLCPDLKFGFNGLQFQFPLADPHFLDVLSLEPDVLEGRSSVQIVLSPANSGKPNEGSRRVMAVLV